MFSRFIRHTIRRSFSTIVFEPDNIAVYDDNEYLHSYGGKPAYVGRDGTKKWYKHGELNDPWDGVPAVLCGNGDKYFYRDGLKHRDGGLPAVECRKHQEYWVNGERHREDGLPAVIIGKYTEYWVNGKFVRRTGRLLMKTAEDRLMDEFDKY